MTTAEHGAGRARPVASGAGRARARVVAFYLPQFHPIPENDEWWGPGFTDWRNVAKARPFFRGHYQPHVPSELGYYDLRDGAVRERQAELALEHRISAFCYYHYWFEGRRLLGAPLDEVLASGRPDFPFCLCWANENWTRRWDGLEDEVLLRQAYSPGWAERFIEDVLPALEDPRYIGVGDSPLLLVYRANLVPDMQRAAELWRSTVLRRTGRSLHLAAVQSFGLQDPRPYGFDSAVEFPPHTERFLVGRRAVPHLDPEFDGYLEDYESVLHHQLGLPLPEYSWYRGAMPAWDNTARRGRQAHILVNSSPAAYQLWLRKLVLQAISRSQTDEPFVFINAWNEWAEGTHLEPDARYGRQWLEATAAGLRDGMRQFYASRGFRLTDAEADRHVRRALPELR
jgi:lipopolysaccharide biosynthesis protein